MTGIYFDAVTGDWAISVEAAGGVCGYAATAQEAAQRLSEEVARWERYHRAQAVTLAAMQNTQQATAHAIEAAPAALPAAPVIARHSAAEREESAKPRCCHYKAIRRCFAIARDLGLNTRDDEGMRAAFGRFLGRALGSRDELTGCEWMLLGDAMKMRRLAW